jgi:hypothetical protein
MQNLCSSRCFACDIKDDADTQTTLLCIQDIRVQRSCRDTHGGQPLNRREEGPHIHILRKNGKRKSSTFVCSGKNITGMYFMVLRAYD